MKQMTLAVAVMLCLMSGTVAARFVSVDPVEADTNNGQNFNRYYYANNNPYKFTDPDGRRIVFALKNGATFSDQATTMGYLGSSSTAAGEILQLHHSNDTYTITFDRGADAGMGYNHDSRTVTINPTTGLRVDSSGATQSPALGGGHEITHAAQHDRVGTQAFENSLEAPILNVQNNSGGGISVTYGVSQEEKRATNVESKMAGELGEASRQNYLDERGPVTTCGPTSTTGC